MSAEWTTRVAGSDDIARLGTAKSSGVIKNRLVVWKIFFFQRLSQSLSPLGAATALNRQSVHTLKTLFKNWTAITCAKVVQQWAQNRMSLSKLPLYLGIPWIAY